MDLQRNHWIIIALVAMNALLFGSLIINSGQLSNENHVVANNAAIDGIMNKLKNSYEAGDDSYVLEVMYQPVVEMFGGREVLLAATRQARSKADSVNLKILSWTTSKPYQYIPTTERLYAIIQYQSTMSMRGQQIQANGYQLGIKNRGEAWQFLAGDMLNPRLYKKIFPDFPKGVDLPIVSTSVNNRFR